MTPRRPETCVGAVVIEGGHLLLIERGRGPALGQWSVPGGRVEWGETLTEAVVREVKEETGLDVVCGAFIDFVERRSADHHYVILDFMARVARPPAVMARGGASAGGTRVDDVSARWLLQAGDDAAGAAWVALDELAATPMVAGMLEFLVDHGLVPDPG